MTGPVGGGSQTCRDDCSQPPCFLAGAAGAALTVSGLDALAARTGAADLPAPGVSGIDHVVVVMMANRSFDHLVGWLPEADGPQAGLAYPDASRKLVPTYPLAPGFAGCSTTTPQPAPSCSRIKRRAT